MPTLLGLNTDELRALAQREGQAAYRGDQIATWLYKYGVDSFSLMNNLPEPFRARLEHSHQVGRAHVITEQRSKDGTVKLLLGLHDGATVETVGLPYADRMSCCVSTQVGCPIGCVFCATGLSGFARNLTAGEMVGQVLAVQEAAEVKAMASNRSNRIDHVTFMGMGEPLLNYEATLKAAHLLNREVGIAMRHLTISTAGLVPEIRRLAQEQLQLTLAVSLHAPTDELRSQLMPGMTTWSVAEIIEACHEYVMWTRRRVTFEYCLLDGINDGVAAAQELAHILHGLNCHANLISFNPIGGSRYRPPPRERVTAFREVLESAGIQVTQRVERGSDIDAACGQLRQRADGTGLVSP